MAFHCKSCNGNMVFDPGGQRMRCKHCGQTCDPRGFVVGAADTGVATDADMSSFACQNCGAELEGTTESMIGRCPYCGGQSLVRGQASDTDVEGILPFRIRKEKCRKLYAEHTRGIPYLPKDYRDARHITNFTGIYMPFYQYDVRFGRIRFKGYETLEETGSYKEIGYYDMTGRFRGTYRRCATFDGSRYLPDELASRAMPFDMRCLRRYSPAYLAGFYADTSTVRHDLYYDEAKSKAQVDAIAHMGKSVSDDLEITAALKDGTNPFVELFASDTFLPPSKVPAKVTDEHLVLFPLWFLTWRKGDRVAYAIVNGESGKVVSDLPLDLRSFWLGSAAIALGIFVLLEVVVQPTPLVTSLVSLAAAGGMGCAIYRSVRREHQRQTHSNDKGWSGGGRHDDADNRKTRHVKAVRGVAEGLIPVLARLGLLLLVVSLFFHSAESSYGPLRAIGEGLVFLFEVIRMSTPVVAIGLDGFAVAWVVRWRDELPTRDPLVSSIVLLISAILNTCIVLMQPVSDFWYYVGDIVCIVGLVFASVGMVRTYNLSTTRPLPKLFDRAEV